jgi:ECF sigma factor
VPNVGGGAYPAVGQPRPRPPRSPRRADSIDLWPAARNRYLRRERPDHTLQSAVLVNQAHLRMIRQQPGQFASRAPFFEFKAQMMQHLLVDHTRWGNSMSWTWWRSPAR